MSEQMQTASPVQARKNRLLLVLLLASFVLPFVVGDLAYKLGWYQGGQTNKGQLLTPPVALSALKAMDAGQQPLPAGFASEHWWMVYVVPANCEAACRNRLFQMRQSPLALGREADRVRSLLVLTATPSAETEALLQKEFAGLIRVQAPAAAVDAALAAAAPQASQAGLLYLMDPMGWIMLTYPPQADEKTSIIKAEDTLDDLRKLMKNSRIG